MFAKDRFRDESFGVALDEAMTGSRAKLYDKLRRASGLPGARHNTEIVQVFAAECARRGAAVDAVLAALLAFDDRLAPFGHVDEFLPMVAVAAIGARMATDPSCDHGFAEALEESSCDLRTRVRDESARALAKVVASRGDSFEPTLSRWIEDDQPYLTRAAVESLRHADSLSTDVLDRLFGLAYARLEREHRAGRRHDAYRKLARSVAEVGPILVVRHVKLVETLAKWAAREDEDVREAIAHAVTTLRRSKFPERGEPIFQVLEATKKPSRDPRWDRLPGKRGRGKH